MWVIESLARCLRNVDRLWSTIKLQLVANDIVAEFGGNLGLEPLDLFRAELNDFALLHIDQMIVILAVGMLKPGAAIVERMALDRSVR